MLRGILEFNQRFIEVHDNLEQFVQNTITPVQETVSSIENIITPVQEIVSSIESTLPPIQELALQAKGISEVFSELFSKQLAFQNEMMEITDTISQSIEAFSNISDFHKELIEYTINYNLLLIGMGWPPVYEIDISKVMMFVNLYKKRGLDSVREEIETYFTNQYDEEIIQQMYENWNTKEWLQKRISILKDAVEAHCQGNFNLSIPTILPQIEGIIYQGFGHIGWQTVSNYQDYVKSLLLTDDEEIVKDVANEFVCNVLLKKFNLGDPLPNNISRHAILHGADVNYGTLINSLKVILLFDYL